MKQKTLRRREDDAAGLADEVEAGGEGEDAADEDEAKLQIRFVLITTGRDSCLRHHRLGRKTGAGPIRGQTPDQICKGKKHQGPPRRATSARSCPTPKLTVSVSLDRKEQPLPKWAWPGRSLGYRE